MTAVVLLKHVLLVFAYQQAALLVGLATRHEPKVVARLKHRLGDIFLALYHHKYRSEIPAKTVPSAILIVLATKTRSAPKSTI